jgi:tRNA A-37 threonylcarbamoyl transferase component Bud32
MDDQRRERFGRYEILGELGRGAMGVVYKARDPKINRVVAVKTVSLAGQPPEDELEYRERFFREAEAAGRLSHPGIVTVFDVGEEPETRSPYIVMEFVSGPTLEKLLSGDNRTLPLETALQVTLELAEALDCAHGQGVVHRDLKPANILIAEDGRAKIADFGVAKLNLANLTQAGRVVGTPAYMSPEQLNGEEVDGRSDLFSLGVILYSVLTGYRPFQGNSAVTVSYKVVNREPVPACVLDTELPPGLDYIIARAMAKDPTQRYQRGMEMVLDIQELREGREPWSKTKEPGSHAGVDAAQTATVRARSWAAVPRPVAVKPRLNNRSLPLGREAGEKLLEIMRTKSFAAAALLLVGLLVLGIGLSYTLWPHTIPSRSPVLGVAAKTLSPEAAPAPAVKAPSPQSAPGPVSVTTKTRKGAPARVAAAAQLAPPGVPQSSPATLEIEINHKFAQAHLSIWVDDLLAYTHLLEGTDKQRLVVFHHVQGHEFHAMQISAGKHGLRVRVESVADSYDQSGTVEGEFGSGKEILLRIEIGKHGEMQLSLQ